MRLPTLKQLASMSWQNADSILYAHERDILEVIDNETLWHRRGRAYARSQLRQKLKRIERFRKELGLT